MWAIIAPLPSKERHETKVPPSGASPWRSMRLNNLAGAREAGGSPVTGGGGGTTSRIATGISWPVPYTVVTSVQDSNVQECSTV
jgi:hypothetical protein